MPRHDAGHPAEPSAGADPARPAADAGHDEPHRSSNQLLPDGGTADGPPPDTEASGPDGGTAGAGRLRRSAVLLGHVLAFVGRWLLTAARVAGTGAVVLLAAVATSTRRQSARRWLLVEANRWVVAGGLVAVVFVGSMALAMTDVVGIAKTGFVVTLFGGVVSGLFSFVPIVISVNQLAVSRLSGTPQDLRDDVDEVRRFREQVERMYASRDPGTASGELVSPTDPDDFLAHVVAVVADRAGDLDASVGEAPDVEAFVAVIREQVAHVRDQIDRGDGRLIELLVALMGDNYSRNVNEARQLQTRYGDALPEPAATALDDLRELFVMLDVLRQYYKSIYIQTVLSRLSRLVVYTGLVAFLLSVFLVVLFAQGPPPTASPLALDLLVSGSLAVATLPFAVLSSYVVQIAAITERTAAPGAFTPPSERPDYSQHWEA